MSEEERAAGQQEFMEALARFQTLQKNAEAYEEHYKELQENIASITSTRESIGELEKAEEGREVLVPLGSGAFATAKIETPDEVIVGLGADVFEKQSLSNAQETLQQRQDELEEASEDIEQKIHETAQELSELMPKLQQMQQTLQQG